MQTKNMEITEYFNDTKIPQLFYDFAKNPVIILPDEAKKFFKRIIPEDEGFMVIAIPKRLR